MNTIKIFSLLLIAIMFNSCKKSGSDTGPYYCHFLFLSVKDASGVDLVKELGLHESNLVFVPKIMPTYHAIHPDLYTLEAVYPDKKMDPVWNHYNTSGAVIPDPTFGYLLEYSINDYGIKDDCYYLVFHPRFSYGFWEKDPPAPMITYKLSCPQIFGDEEVHEIVTYWKPIPDGYGHQSCYRIVYAGKEFSDITHGGGDGVLSFATIILEK